MSPADQNEMTQEFKALYKRKFKIELSDQEALAKASLLIQFWRIVRRPIRKKNEFKNSQKENVN